MQKGLHVAGEFRHCSGRPVHHAYAVELEIIQIVVMDHLDARISKPCEISRPGQREAVLICLEALLPAVFETFLLGFAVTAEGGKPRAQDRIMFFDHRLQRRETVGKTLVESP